MLTKSSTELVRQQNSALVLAALRRDGAALAYGNFRLTPGLPRPPFRRSPPTGTGRSHREIRTAGAGGRGRPRVLFAQRRDCGYLIVVSISSDVVQYSLVDYAGKLIDRFEEARNRMIARHGAFRRMGFVDGLERMLSRSRLDA